MSFQEKILYKKLSQYNNYLILGFGKEGQSTYRLLRKMFPEKKIFIHDINENIQETYPIVKSDKYCKFNIGYQYISIPEEAEIVFKSPGISLLKSKIQINQSRLSSQTDLFLEIFKEKTIGITGTKGKSTTSSLIYHIFSEAGKDVILVGNIGLPPFDFIQKIKKETTIVFELSSHQLEYSKASPHFGVLLNVFQEHLDHYSSYEAYIAAKCNIFKNQLSSDYLIINADDETIRKKNQQSIISSNILSYSILHNLSNGTYIKNNKIVHSYNNFEIEIAPSNLSRKILGTHNLSNILAATTVSLLNNIPTHLIRDGIGSFKGLPHRIEYVGEINNIKFYNDSIATIPEASMAAIESLNDVGALIIGGYDRGIDYSNFARYLSQRNIDLIIFLGEAGKRIAKELNKINMEQKHFHVDNLKEAFGLALKYTKPFKICLLSPAAASYDQFKNFEERGNIFRNLVLEEIKKEA